jgi:lipoprotein-anchoring transpeptidase ErfK/SrfK
MIGGKADTLLFQVQAAARAGRKLEARRLLTAAIRLEPNRADLWVSLARVASSPGAAADYLTRALALEPDNPLARDGLRWAQQHVAQNPAAGPRPATAQSVAPSTGIQLREWAAGALLAALLILTLAAMLFATGLPAALAAWEPTAPAVTSAVGLLSGAKPQRARELPATWTPAWTPTSTPSPTVTPTPSRTPTPSPTETPTRIYPSPTWVPTRLPPPITPGTGGERWIDVDLTHQLLIAYEGETPVRWVPVSSGLARYPTVVGQFRVYVKYLSTHMSGDGYDYPDVPHTMYYYKGYAVHGAYWHNNFGHPMSHGCVNLPLPEAEWLYGFASVGTLVNVHY